MPRYFINVRNQGGLALDPEGAEFADFDSALTDVLVSAKELIASNLLSGIPLDEAERGSIEIADESGKVLIVVPLTEAATADLRDEMTRKEAS